eukprot:CAMPEP_0184348050 /NCGR_PEP_ID=MMETSP1089-20130417/23392_1 /TAXON_ID=38269 ORGANISM="Gloeochaete wittrockiana, Strain SAG46.84" /NCGR_SAMPLE_ID=MMETSP1089 /ASSEMBLY_ACC=CAM_ASM_000445 /LENGTH=304 /DNA_ID=CAMNT_0026679539 /DNA_START=23 /DNA_END=937 /DNA_ORIENTATION=+
MAETEFVPSICLNGYGIRNTQIVHRNEQICFLRQYTSSRRYAKTPSEISRSFTLCPSLRSLRFSQCSLFGASRSAARVTLARKGLKEAIRVSTSSVAETAEGPQEKVVKKHPDWFDWPWPDSVSPNDEIELKDDSVTPALTHRLFWAVIREEPGITDAMLNAIMCYLMGYRYDTTAQAWDLSGVQKYWKSRKGPPIFIDMRVETVRVIRLLNSTVPYDCKALLKTELGFTGWKIKDLTPLRTRRATVVNWMLAYNHQERNNLPLPFEPQPEHPMGKAGPLENVQTASTNYASQKETATSETEGK